MKALFLALSLALMPETAMAAGPSAPPAPAGACYEIVPKMTPGGDNFLLNRCTGQAWFIINAPSLDSAGKLTGKYYKWDPIIVGNSPEPFSVP